MAEPLSGTPSRKSDHVRINLEEDVQHRDVTTGLERYRFLHNALPELDLHAIDLSTSFLGHRLRAPLLISSMTGGIEDGWELTRRLAVSAQAHGVAIGVGSQRAAIEDASLARWYQVRDVAPDVPLFANLGAVQLINGYGLKECQRAIEMIGADALILHLNPLQEALQPEGDSGWSGAWACIAALCSELQTPVIVKEVGFGISADVAKRLVSAGVAAIDVSGAGGTSWSAVEHHRAPTAHIRRVSETFIDWGIPTASCVVMAREAAPDTPLIASGGLRTGLDAAKALALGADLAGFAGPLLRAAATSQDAATDLLAALIDEVRLSMFGTGAGTIEALKTTPLLDEQGHRPPRA